MQARKTTPQFESLLSEHWNRKQGLKLMKFSSWIIQFYWFYSSVMVADQTLLQADPRPTIYSGQVSFGLLLSAHSSPGQEQLGGSASARLLTLLEPPSKLSLNNENSSKLDEAGPVLGRWLSKRQIFERRQPSSRAGTSINGLDEPTTISGVKAGASGGTTPLGNNQLLHHPPPPPPPAGQSQSSCSQVNAQALYAGMGAIWASHQANLVADSQLSLGAYVYDSCSDLEVGQRQAVRIVANLNAFQQTTCEAPRGSPISLAIAHGDNQLRAIQLLTSFRLPVITTREHFVLEEYQSLTREQRRFLFSTAPSSRHLALGALRFSKRIVARSGSSAKLNNRFHRLASRNGLIVVSRNLPARFVSHLTETVPQQVNYQLIYSDQPIEQIRSLEALESVLLSTKVRQRKRSQQQSEESQLVGVATDAPEKAAHLEKAEPGDKDQQLAHETEELQDLAPAKVIQAEPEEVLQTSATSAGSELRAKIRQIRQAEAEAEAETEAETADEASPGADETRMLSPTILMFITPDEAIDLITRLRNDLAQVSRYYSLIVATREDIAPALRTIFQRGGARLCPNRPFYTISPRPDELNEFSRYFRDTVQLEGEASDHPLVCEFARHHAQSKLSADLDDLATEPVIKAVWSAAAAFKSVFRRECGPDKQPQTNQASPAGQQVGATSSINKNNQQASNQTGANQTSGNQGMTARSAPNQSECLSKLGKSMSVLVQRALRRLDASINSTGLQALDGFRLRFDELNELMTNRFSVRYINKECEITEIGQYSGLRDSRLRLDEPALAKSLEASLPEPWPSSSTGTSVTRAPLIGTTTVEKEASGNSDSPSSTGTGDSNAPGTGSDPGDQPEEPREAPRPGQRRKQVPPDEIEHVVTAPVLPTATPNQLTPIRTKKRARAGESSGRRKWANQSAQQVLPSTTTSESTSKPGRLLRPFPSSQGTSLREWLPASTESTGAHWSPNSHSAESTTTSTRRTLSPIKTTTVRLSDYEPEPDKNAAMPSQSQSQQQQSQQTGDISTTSPAHSTLPESDGNADLELPAIKSSRSVTASPAIASTTIASTSARFHAPITVPSALETAASSQLGAQDYVSAPSAGAPSLLSIIGLAGGRELSGTLASLALPSGHSWPPSEMSRFIWDGRSNLSLNRSTTALSSHASWIYSSWCAMSILAANICGALLTLYVLIYLLMKNCDGSLQREANQGLRSLHLLAIIVVFFGSTLFILHPTPALCLLRSSWHNFALVMLFGSLLLQSMQLRSANSLGLGGRTNRLNQFLTMLFMVGVQVSFELQRWKYESATYFNFVQQDLTTASLSGLGKLRKTMISNSAILHHPLFQFNPMGSSSKEIDGETQQDLLRHFCPQPADEFLQSQIYLTLIVVLLLVLSVANRRMIAGSSSTSKGPVSPLLSSRSTGLSSGKLVAGEHEANLIPLELNPPSHTFSQVQFSAQNQAGSHHLFIITILGAAIYTASLLAHAYGQRFLSLNRDLLSSITMVSLAFLTLLTIFVPILIQVRRPSMANSGSLASSRRPKSSLAVIQNQALSSASGNEQLLKQMTVGGSVKESQSRSAFVLFPEFASTGLRRPSSVSAASTASATSSFAGTGSRRPFAETKLSRRNLRASLAELAPSEDSLRSMADMMAFGPKHHNVAQPKPAAVAGKTELEGPVTSRVQVKPVKINQSSTKAKTSAKSCQNAACGHLAGGEKRLIMLGVDPGCPRHGIRSSWNPEGSSGGQLQGKAGPA